MDKALWANAPLPYPQLVTLFLRHFQIPLNDEPFVQVKRSFAIGAGAVTSFGYRKDRNGQSLKKDAPYISILCYFQLFDLLPQRPFILDIAR